MAPNKNNNYIDVFDVMNLKYFNKKKFKNYIIYLPKFNCLLYQIANFDVYFWGLEEPKILGGPT